MHLQIRKSLETTGNTKRKSMELTENMMLPLSQDGLLGGVRGEG